MEALDCPIARAAAQTPQALALLESTRSLGYAALDALARRTGEALRTKGIGPGDVFALEARPDLDTLATLIAAWRIGAWTLPLNPKAPAAEIERLLNTGGAKLHLHADELALASVGTTTTQETFHPDASVLIATSGTSGTPKLALLPLRGLQCAAERSNANIPVHAGDRWLLSLPLFHVSGLGMLLRTWSAGATVLLPGALPLHEALALLAPTHVSLVATQLRRCLSDSDALVALQRTKAILLGGSAFPEGLIAEAHAAGLSIHKSYGLTEMGSQVATTRPGATLEELHTSGYALAPDTLRISAEGEIEVRGDTLFAGYYRADAVPRLVRPATADGWYPTGDLGRLDAAGRLVVLGRKDHMFISGGENVHPEEVERALAGVPCVEQALVVALPDPEYGEVGVAFVAMSGWDEDLLRTHLRASLPAYKVPKRFLPWPEDAPAGGIKPSRAWFRERAKEKCNR